MGNPWACTRSTLSVLALLVGARSPGYCQTSATTGLWQDSSYVDSLSGQKVWATSLTPTADTDNEFQQTGIVIRCDPDGTLELALGWDQKLTSDPSVRTYEVDYRIGTEDVQDETWSMATNEQEVFYDDRYLSVVSFILHLETSNAFVAQVIPTGMNPISATYDTTGLLKAAAPVMGDCGYGKSPD